MVCAEAKVTRIRRGGWVELFDGHVACAVTQDSTLRRAPYYI